jgi:hypothetical protein
MTSEATMPTIGFTVEGELPPKKDGAKSMWDKPLEARRLLALRRAAVPAMNGGPPLSRAISLTLDIYVPQHLVTFIGDLDTFITGVCDGLMAAHPRADLGQIWLDPQLADVHPSRSVAIVNDSEVVSIMARKVAQEAQEPAYQVVLEAKCRRGPTEGGSPGALEPLGGALRTPPGSPWTSKEERQAPSTDDPIRHRSPPFLSSQKAL